MDPKQIRGKERTKEIIPLYPTFRSNMFAQLNLSRLTVTENIGEGDIALESIHSSPATITSRQELIAERPPDAPHVLLPMSYPVLVSPYERREGDIRKVEWVVRAKPLKKVGVGMELFGMKRGVGGVMSAEIAGEVVGVERFDREHVVFKVEGGSGLEWRVGVRYSSTTVGVWRRVWVFFTTVNDYAPKYRQYKVMDWVGYVGGPFGWW